MLTKYNHTFASDNNSGVHSKVMGAIIKANEGHVIAYGDDPYTRSAIEKFREVFGADAETAQLAFAPAPRSGVVAMAGKSRLISL